MTLPRLTPQQERELAACYKAGSSLVALVVQYDIAKSTVRNILKRQGVPSRAARNPGFWNQEAVTKMVTDHSGGASDSAIGRSLGISQAAVSRKLRQLGVVPRKPRARGPDHGSWKGGRVLNENGYVMIRDSRNSKYVPEHRLVMSAALGRPLTRSESVHHINGDKTDNRLDNLQLRQGQHGVGVAHQCLDCGSTNVATVRLRSSA